MLNYIEIVFRGYSQLQKEANAVALSYLSLVKKAAFIKNKRININIVNHEDKFLEIDGPQDAMVSIDINYNVSNYLQKDWELGRKIIYEIVFYCMDALAEANDWDPVFFEALKADIISREYIIYTPYSKALKRKKVTAQLFVCHDVAVSDFRLNVYSSNSSILKTINVFKTFQNPNFVAYFLAKVMWLTDSIFRISDRNDEIFMDVNIEEESVKFNFEPKQGSVEALKKHLLAIKYDTPEHLRKQYMQA